MTDLYRQLLYQLELDRDLGVQFLPRLDAVRSVSSDATSQSLSAIPPIIDGPAAAALAAIAQHLSNCQRCGLCEKRSQVVPGSGNPNADILFIADAPSAEEEQQGQPFAGEVGDLFDKMLSGMQLQREQVFITNLVKCRPPGSRSCSSDEAATCRAWLEQQVQIIKPKIICSMGNAPLRTLTNNPKAGISQLRGQRFDWQGIPVIPTFHPAYLLRNPEAKRPCWEDLKLLMSSIGRPLT